MCSRKCLTRRQGRRPWAAALLVVAALLAGCGRSPAASPPGAAGRGTGPGQEAAPPPDAALRDADTVVHVRFEQPAGRGARWRIVPDRIEVPHGKRVALVVENDQPLPHDLVLGEPYNLRTPLVRRGERYVLTFVADRRTEGTPFWCSVPGHREIGMEGVLVVR